MKNTYILIYIIITITSLRSFAQDVHFSQFWNTPLLQNPSFSGKANEPIRAIVNYRSQWGSITSNPFKTFGANFDMRFRTSSKGNSFAGGISMYTDVAGASKMRTTLANLSGAYHLNLDNRNHLSAGLQVGINQKSIDSYDLRFDNQFDGFGHNPNLSSNENLVNSSEIRPTVSAGISYMWSNSFNSQSNRYVRNKRMINIGFSVHHFNAPKYYFSHQEELGFRYIGSIEASFNLSTTPWSIKPYAFVAVQRKATDIVLGTIFEYAINNESQITNFKKGLSVGFGGLYRFQDAIIPTFQIQWDSFQIGFNYDVNLSQLSIASKGNGGFELSLKYIFKNSLIKNRSKIRKRY